MPVYTLETPRDLEVVPRIYIKKKGIFSLGDVLNIGTNWFGLHKYYFTEKEHTEKNKPEGHEIWVEWNAYRKIDGYFKFHINILFLIYRYNPVEMDEEGLIIKKGHGQLEITIRGVLMKDYRGRFEKFGNFGEFLRIMYERYLIKKRYDEIRGKLQDEVLKLHNELKRGLGELVI